MSSRALATVGLIMAAPLFFALTGCAPVDPGMGEAVKYDALAQTVNPEPVYLPGGALPGGDGTHGAKATERYRKDTVKAIQRERTGQSISGGGGGSSGGGSGGSQ